MRSLFNLIDVLKIRYHLYKYVKHLLEHRKKKIRLTLSVIDNDGQVIKKERINF